MTQHLPELLADTIWLHLLTKLDARAVLVVGEPVRSSPQQTARGTAHCMRATWRETPLLQQNFALVERGDEQFVIRQNRRHVFNVVSGWTPDALAGIYSNALMIVVLGRLKPAGYEVINGYVRSGARLLLLEE